MERVSGRRARQRREMREKMKEKMRKVGKGEEAGAAGTLGCGAEPRARRVARTFPCVAVRKHFIPFLLDQGPPASRWGNLMTAPLVAEAGLESRQGWSWGVRRDRPWGSSWVWPAPFVAWPATHLRQAVKMNSSTPRIASPPPPPPPPYTHTHTHVLHV